MFDVCQDCFLFGELRTQLTISVHCLTNYCSCGGCLWKACIGKSWSSGHCGHFERGSKVSYKGVCVTAKFSAVVQNSVNKTTSATLSTLRAHFTLCRYCKPLFEIFVEHGITLIQQINIPKRMFSDVAILYISFNNFLSTRASISSRIDSNSFELRRRQISIQQKLVRQISDMTHNFCVSSQQAQPRCRPLTKRLVRMFVELRMTFSPASAKSSTKTKITYPFCVFVL